MTSIVSHTQTFRATWDQCSLKLRHLQRKEMRMQQF